MIVLLQFYFQPIEGELLGDRVKPRDGAHYLEKVSIVFKLIFYHIWLVCKFMYGFMYVITSGNIEKHIIMIKNAKYFIFISQLIINSNIF